MIGVIRNNYDKEKPDTMTQLIKICDLIKTKNDYE